MKSWIIVLASAAGLGLLSEDAFAADRSRSSSSSPRHSSSSSPRHSLSSSPRHSSTSSPRHSFSSSPRHSFSSSHQHRHHHSHGLGIVVAPSFWAWPYYYDPAPVYAAPAVAPPVNGGYWYFCPDSRAYYPYVAECRSGWQAVVPGSAPPN